MRPPQVALLSARELKLARELAAALNAGGEDTRLLIRRRAGSRTLFARQLERRLERRAFEQDLTAIPAAYLALARGTDDIAHAFDLPDAVAAALWARRRGRAAVFSLMSTADRTWLVARRLRLACMRRAARECASVVVPSHFAAAALWSSLGVRSRVIYPGLDLQRLVPGGELSEKPTIYCAAAPSDAIGPLIEALPVVRRSRSDVVLELAPDSGTERRAWAFAVAAQGDGFEPAIVESLAAGRPVLAVAGGANAEVLDRPQLGSLFNPEDRDDVARAMLEALEAAADPSTASACRRRAADFSIDRCADAYRSLYRELL